VTAVRIIAAAAGAIVVIGTLHSAILTVVVPRGERVLVSRAVFVITRSLYGLYARGTSQTRRDRIMARYAPVSLMLLPIVWAIGVMAGFIPLYWAVGVDDWSDILTLTGSSLATLGYARPEEGAAVVLSVTEAFIGLALVALLISFLPTIYSHFSRREQLVGKLASRGGSPPTPIELITRLHEIEWVDEIDRMWPEWESWFVELGESHTSHPALVFFRSQSPHESWILAAACVLDTASIQESALDQPSSPEAQLCIRAGYLALRDVAHFYGIGFDADPRPDDPISIQREEFACLVEELRNAGVPVKSDLDQAWKDYAGWRVNYDQALLGLCALVQAPPAPWSSDRAPEFHRPPIFRRVETGR
jgi:hypothetical protein